MDFWRPGNIEYFRMKNSNKTRLLGAIPDLKVGALRSSPIGEFWNTTLRPKARGFKPSNVFVTKWN